MHPLVTRLPLRLTPDSSRVITRFFNPGDLKRSRDIIERVLTFPEHDIEERLAELERTFGPNHPDLQQVFAEHLQQIQAAIPVDSRSEPGSGVVDRCLLHDGIRHRVGRTVQSVDRPGLRSGRCAAGGHSIPHEPACHRRRPSVVDRLPHGNHRRRRGGSARCRRDL